MKSTIITGSFAVFFISIALANPNKRDADDIGLARIKRQLSSKLLSKLPISLSTMNKLRTMAPLVKPMLSALKGSKSAPKGTTGRKRRQVNQQELLSKLPQFSQQFQKMQPMLGQLMSQYKSGGFNNLSSALKGGRKRRQATPTQKEWMSRLPQFTQQLQKMQPILGQLMTQYKNGGLNNLMGGAKGGR